MPFLADRLACVKPSPTRAMTALATQRKAAGRNIISRSVSEPDFDTPSNSKEAAKAAINAGDTKSTVFDGRIELKRAVRGDRHPYKARFSAARSPRCHPKTLT
jgi:aspartate aminotransferase